MTANEILTWLELRAEKAVEEHTRLVLMIVLHYLQHAESKDQAIADIADLLQRYGSG